MITCTSCHGKRYGQWIFINDGLCPACHGTGVVHDDAERRELICLSIQSRMHDIATRAKQLPEGEHRQKLRNIWAKLNERLFTLRQS